MHKKAYISDSFVLNPQFSVYLSLFYYMTKVTENVFKNHLCVLFSLRRVTLSLIYFSLKQSGKENITYKPALKMSISNNTKPRVFVRFLPHGSRF